MTHDSCLLPPHVTNVSGSELNIAGTIRSFCIINPLLTREIMLVGHQGRVGWPVESTGLKEDESDARQYASAELWGRVRQPGWRDGLLMTETMT